MDTPDEILTAPPALIYRLEAVLTALRDGPLPRPDLLQRLGEVYPNPISGRRMMNRDIEYLRTLGIEIERSRTRPPVYTLHGAAPILDAADLQSLALVRDTFQSYHPQAAQIQRLLARLTSSLTRGERSTYEHHRALRTAIHPAIDYTPFANLISRLEAAISSRQMLCFHYLPLGKRRPTLHPKVEPYEIEFYERHFYLVAYSYNTDTVFDFRIDRIQQDATFKVLPDNWAAPRRPLITFHYRLAAVVAQGELSQRFVEQQVIKRCTNGDVIIEARGRSDFFILRTLLKYAHYAELLDPPELRAKMARLVQDMARLYDT